MEQKQAEKKKTQAEIEIEVLQDYESIQLNKDPLTNLIATLSNSANKTEKDEMKKKFITKFHLALYKFPADKLIDEVYSKLDAAQSRQFFNYLNYSFELIGNQVRIDSNSFSSSYLLKAFNKYVEYRGTVGIIEGISAKKTLVTQVITIK